MMNGVYNEELDLKQGIEPVINQICNEESVSVM